MNKVPHGGIHPDDARCSKLLLGLLYSAESCDQGGPLQAESKNLVGYELKLYLKATFFLMLRWFYG